MAAFDPNLLRLVLISLIGILGLILIVWAGSQIRKRHLLRASLGLCSGLVALSTTLVFILIISNLYTYQRFTKEQTVATVHIDQLGRQHYLLSLDFPSRPLRNIYEIHGDEWQIDARILKWKYPLIWLGLDTHYQLDRVSGRYLDIQDESSQERSVYSLRPAQKADLWRWLREYQEFLPFIDALYGSASYLPMVDQAVYELSLTQTGLVARAKNSAAEAGIKNWGPLPAPPSADSPPVSE